MPFSFSRLFSARPNVVHEPTPPADKPPEYVAKFSYDKDHDSSPSGTQTPTTALDIEPLPYLPSLPPTLDVPQTSPKKPEEVSPQQDRPVVPRYRARLAAAFLSYICIGWADGATGTVMPYFQTDFGLTYTTTSLLFITSAAGLLIGTFCFEWIFQKLGRVYVVQDRVVPAFLYLWRRPQASATYMSRSRAQFYTLLLGTAVHACWYAMMGSKQGYVCLLLAFAIAGFGRGYMFAVCNSYVAGLPTKPLGSLHACWGFGGFASPLVAQALISHGVGWNIFYFISLAWSGIALTSALLAFRPTSAERDDEHAAGTGVVSTSTDSVEAGMKEKPAPVTSAQSQSTLLRCCKTPLIWAYCAFFFIYSGSETTANGFFVSYLLQERHANPEAVGYFGSLWYAGFFIARYVVGLWMQRHSYRAGKFLIHGFIFSALTWNLCIWLVSSLGANIAFIGLDGFSCGPMFPMTVYLSTFLLPEELHMVGIALMTAFSSFGAAILPFISGVLSNIPSIGLNVVPKLLVAEGGILLVAWFFFPSTIPKRSA